MFPRSFTAVLPLTIALAALPGSVNADIYTWIDSSGIKTYSDAPPPKGVRVLDVLRETPVKPLTAAEIAAKRDAEQQAQIQSLNDRIRSLEQETRLARYPVALPSSQYSAPPPSLPCDPAWSGCDSFWPAPFLSVPVVVIRRPHDEHRFRFQQRMGNHQAFHGNGRSG